MAEEYATEVWNRACSLLEGDDDGTAREGDRALAEVLMFDGVVQNGGLGSAIEQELIVPALVGLRWLGLDDVARVVEAAAQRVAGAEGDADAEEAAFEAVELEDDAAYYDLATPERFTAALETRLDASPEAFAPVVTA